MDEEQVIDAIEAVVDLSQVVPPADLPQVVHDIAEVVPVEVLPVDPLPAHAVSWFSHLLTFFAHHAYFLTFFGALVENTIVLGFFLPGGAIVALAGAGGRQADLSLPALIVLAAAGMCAGAAVDYFLGRAGIARVLHHPWLGRWGPRFATQLEECQPLLRRHGWWMMLMAHAFGTGRSSLAVAAGASGLPLWRFLLIEAPAALLWSAVYAGGGYFLASQWITFELVLRRVGWVGTLGLVAVVVGWLVYHKRRSRVPAPAPAPATVTADGSVNGTVIARAYVPALATSTPITQELASESSGRPVEPLR
jgi:membrane-associated protein